METKERTDFIPMQIVSLTDEQFEALRRELESQKLVIANCSCCGQEYEGRSLCCDNICPDCIVFYHDVDDHTKYHHCIVHMLPEARAQLMVSMPVHCLKRYKLLHMG